MHQMYWYTLVKTTQDQKFYFKVLASNVWEARALVGKEIVERKVVSEGDKDAWMKWVEITRSPAQAMIVEQFGMDRSLCEPN